MSSLPTHNASEAESAEDSIEYASLPNQDILYTRDKFNSEDLGSMWNSLMRTELGPAEKTGNMVDDFFRITHRGSTIMTEIIGWCFIFIFLFLQSLFHLFQLIF